MEAIIKLPEGITTVWKVRKEDLEGFIRETIAIECYREGLVSLGKAAEIAGLERIDMMDLLRRKKVPIQYGVDDLDKDIQTLEKVLK